MTEQEAIEKIKDLSDRGYPTLRTAKEIAIKALEEVQQYREMNRKLREVYGNCDGLIEIAVDGLCKYYQTKDTRRPYESILLTDEDALAWRAYKEIGTVEECREAVEKQKPKKPEIYTDTVQTMNGSFQRDVFECPVCGDYVCNVEDEIPRYCQSCGQKLEESEGE